MLRVVIGETRATVGIVEVIYEYLYSKVICRCRRRNDKVFGFVDRLGEEFEPGMVETVAIRRWTCHL